MSVGTWLCASVVAAHRHARDVPFRIHFRNWSLFRHHPPSSVEPTPFVVVLVRCREGRDLCGSGATFAQGYRFRFAPPQQIPIRSGYIRMIVGTVGTYRWWNYFSIFSFPPWIILNHLEEESRVCGSYRSPRALRAYHDHWHFFPISL